MINILIVDDDTNKTNKISEVINSVIQHDESNIDIAKNVCEAVALLSEKCYSLMVLDLNLPTREGRSPSPNNGICLFDQLDPKSGHNLPQHVFGLTSYEDYVSEYRSYFSDLAWGLFHYDPSSDEWARTLARKCEYILNSLKLQNDHSFNVDMVIITALDSELDQVLKLPANWKKYFCNDDDTCYYTGAFTNESTTFSVVSCSAIHKGMPASTALAVKACINFKPKYLAMTGIAAGVTGGFGDIMIADQGWDYGSGKIQQVNSSPEISASFLPEPKYLSVDLGILGLIRRFCSDNAEELFHEIENNFHGTCPKTSLSYNIGPIASGAAVLEDRKVIEEIKKHDRKLIAIEMEAYGVLMAAEVCPAPRPKAMIFKSISDLGNTEKSDDWQRYAAYTSAYFLYKFALSELSSL